MRHLRRHNTRTSKVSSSRRLLLGNIYLLKVKALKRTLANWDNLFDPTNVDDEDRIQQLIRLNIVGGYLTAKYSWAIPDEQALGILSNWSPLIELGCGNGYWSRLLHDRGVNVVAVDAIGCTNTSWTYVLKGGPKVLRRSEFKGRTLFLCYPDEFSNLGSRCLRYFDGDTVIHVGELLITGTKCAYPQRPWGRTSSAEFQTELYETFHCILRAKLPTYPVSMDYITVWKRTSFVAGREYETDPTDVWVGLPGNEVLRDEDSAAPSVKHLLRTI